MEMLRQETLNLSLGNRGQRKVSREALQVYASQTGGGGERGLVIYLYVDYEL